MSDQIKSGVFSPDNLRKVDESNLVILASGSPLMRVVAIEGDHCLCQWVDDAGTIQRHLFTYHVLRRPVSFHPSELTLPTPGVEASSQEHRQIYALTFNQGEWAEIESLSMGCGVSRKGWAFTRPEWVAVAYSALGKAEMLLDDKLLRRRVQAAALRRIAAAIFSEFKPGDGSV